MEGVELELAGGSGGEGEDDEDPLLQDGGGRRRGTRLIFDNSRLDVREGTLMKSRCSVRQLCMSLLGVITSSVVGGGCCVILELNWNGGKMRFSM